VVIVKPFGPWTPECRLPNQEISIMHRLAIVAVVSATVFTTASSMAAAATAKLTGPDGADTGTVTLTEMPNGVLLKAELRGLPQGEHGFHIHEKGACAPDFGAAGGHFAGGGGKHGYAAEDGPHAGDMPNIHVPASGELTIEVFNGNVSLQDGEGMLLDDDGSAIVIHAKADDYKSQPSGDAGDRIACGVIEK
jgi:Cu-Zn family superoxide dismutase